MIENSVQHIARARRAPAHSTWTDTPPRPPGSHLRPPAPALPNRRPPRAPQQELHRPAALRLGCLTQARRPRTRRGRARPSLALAATAVSRRPLKPLRVDGSSEREPSERMALSSALFQISLWSFDDAPFSISSLCSRSAQIAASSWPVSIRMEQSGHQTSCRGGRKTGSDATAPGADPKKTGFLPAHR